MDGATFLFLPKCSPALKPIEPLFAKLKHWLRRAGEQTRDRVCNAIAQILNAITATECANDLVNSGYARTSSHPALGVGLASVGALSKMVDGNAVIGFAVQETVKALHDVRFFFLQVLQQFDDQG